VQSPGRPDSLRGQQRLDVGQALLGQPGRLGGHHHEHALPGQAKQLGGLPERVPVGRPPGEQGLHQRRAFPGPGEQQLRRGLPVGDGELLGVLADQPPHAGGGVDERLGGGLVASAGLLDDRLPQLGEADPVGVQDVGQRRALLGPAAAGLAGRRQVGGPVGGELGDHRLEVAGHRVSQVLEAHHLPVTVELDLGQQPLDDPVDQHGKPGPDRPGDLGDLGGQDDALDPVLLDPAVRSLAGAVIGVGISAWYTAGDHANPKTTCRSWTPAWPTWRRACRCDRPSGAGRLPRSAGLVPARPRPAGWHCRSCWAGGRTSRAGATR
jgi:hypothetical protein